MASGETGGVRDISTYLIWDSTKLAGYDDSAKLDTTIKLNDSDNSALGPGVYLDLDTVLFQSTLRGTTGGYKPSVWGFEKVLTFKVNGSSDIAPLTEYVFRFASEHGEAERDNAEILVEFTREEPECEIFCGQEFAYCNLQEEPWGIGPIPGEYQWPSLPNERCGSGTRSWLPTIFR